MVSSLKLANRTGNKYINIQAKADEYIIKKLFGRLGQFQISSRKSKLVLENRHLKETKSQGGQKANENE